MRNQYEEVVCKGHNAAGGCLVTFVCHLLSGCNGYDSDACKPADLHDKPSQESQAHLWQAIIMIDHEL